MPRLAERCKQLTWYSSATQTVAYPSPFAYRIPVSTLYHLTDETQGFYLGFQICGPHHVAVRTSLEAKRELIKRIGDKKKETDLSELSYTPYRKRNSGWVNIENANRIRTAERLKKEWQRESGEVP